MTARSYASLKEAQEHYRSGFRYEVEAQWDNAEAEYEAAIQICVELDSLAMEALVRAYLARVLRNIGKMQRAVSYISRADELLSVVEEERTSLYVRSEVETIWGTLYLKMPLLEDKKEAKLHFKQAIQVLEKLQANVEQDGPFAGTSAFLLNLVNRSALMQEINHNLAVNNINLAQLCLHEGMGGELEADNIANAVIQIANKLIDHKLLGAATRIKGQIALQKCDYDAAIHWFKQSLFEYRQHRVVNPEAVTAVTAKLLHAQTMHALEVYEHAGSPKRLKWFDKIPRPIVYLYKPFLFNLERYADKMPADQARLLYIDASIHWGGADWQDRCYKYLVKAVACADNVRINQLVGGEFHAHRRTEYFAERTLLPFHHLITLLLSPKYSKRIAVTNPIAEAFYYREKCGAIGLLDELKTAEHLITAHVDRSGQQAKLVQIRQDELIHIEQQPKNRNYVRALEDKRAEEIKELCDPELQELLTGQVTHLDEVQRLLPEHSVLIEYILTEHLFAIFVVTPHSASVPVFEVSESHDQKLRIFPEEINQRVKDFLYAISHEMGDNDKPTGLPVEHNLDTVKQQAQWLYETLLRPTESAWRTNNSATVDRLIIVPHGILHQLPYSTLFDGERFVTEIIPTVQVPSASILQYCYAKRPHHPVKFSYFGLANPLNEPGLEGCEDAVLAAIRQLGFKGETWIENRLEDASKSILAVRHEMATKSVWLENAPRYGIVDLETHGSLINESSLGHSFLLADDSEEGEFWFTANDIFLNLRMCAELLVAAMCYSGQAKVFGGDESSGLVRAFLYAGCRSILLYPWALVDNVAKEFTQMFYQHYIELNSTGNGRTGHAKDIALKEAQTHIITLGRQGERVEKYNDFDLVGTASWEHPYYWGWILIGDHL